MIEGMIAMAVEDDWISVAKAAEEAGCSEQFIRRELLAHIAKDANGKPIPGRTKGGRLDGWLMNGKAWSVSRASVIAFRGSLSSRATLHKDEREARKAKLTPRASRKKAARRRKKPR